MKTFKSLLLLVLIFSVATVSGVKKPGKEKKTVQQKVESKDFTFYVDHCLPTDLVNSSFNSDVVIKIKDGIATADLPFHGKLSVNPSEMTSGPITFNGPMYDVTFTQRGEKGWNILFKVDSDPYTYQVDMDITSKGKAEVRVTSKKRTTMTYFGEID